VSRGGYPDTPGSSPAQPGGLSRHDCVVLDDFPHALCFAFRSDNLGPPVDITVHWIYLTILLILADLPKLENKMPATNSHFSSSFPLPFFFSFFLIYFLSSTSLFLSYPYFD